MLKQKTGVSEKDSQPFARVAKHELRRMTILDMNAAIPGFRQCREQGISTEEAIQRLFALKYGRLPIARAVEVVENVSQHESRTLVTRALLE